jgi:hypothetical protein
MDGVLTDFDKRYTELFGERPTDVQRRAKHFWANWEKFIRGANFSTLDKHKDADTLLHFVHELRVPVEILSSSGGNEFHSEVTWQKTVWLCNNSIPYKANIVAGGSKKAEFASPWNILVDDTEHVVEKYREAGGTAILHKDIDFTLKELSRLHLEWQGGE